MSQRAFYIGDIMHLRWPGRVVLGVGISSCCLFRRILWTARTLHEASEAISLVSNPSFSKVLIKIYCAVFCCGAISLTRNVDPGGMGKRKEGEED
jgi:hypothetical protein